MRIRSKKPKDGINRLIHLATGMLVIILAQAGFIVYQQQIAAQQRAELYEQLVEQRDQFVNCQDSTDENPIAGCQEPVSDPESIQGEQGIPGVQGPQGPQGPPGPPPSDAQVFEQVDAFCSARNDCEGPQGLQGPQGEQGPQVSSAEVFDQIAAYCADGACVGPQGEQGPVGAQGPQGEPGDPGPPGEQGPGGPPGEQGPQGPPGPPPSDDQVNQWFNDYCTNNGCEGAQGPQGEPGPAGEPGAPGVGIASIACGEDGNWYFTMTDGSTQTVAGPCRATLLG